MEKPNHPLAEVFGHLTTDLSQKADRFRRNKLCPFNNRVPSCTKDKANDPLGVCSIHSKDRPVITCPVRFREDWLIAEDAANFFFSNDSLWTSLAEVRLTDRNGNSAGNIDLVLVAYDENGNVTDFGALEIQAVYISGNIRAPFTHYMKNCQENQNMDWRGQPNYPRPDFLSSSRKRLVPQLMFKGGILQGWNKKMAVALDSTFFHTLPELREVDKESADIAWLVYDLVPVASDSRYSLRKTKTIYTQFADALNAIAQPKAGDVEVFLKTLQAKVDEKLESPPTNRLIDSPLDRW